ncbi:splicing factor 3B subunit 2-like [Pyrus ussuriensis x Pyrus communis]|uniref:Splicing factor 3B subunit 2-like n=1 Tax=Pyrus ussuriensis x Pyrus communis TaxID=2448454 RepID=A0A5N5FR68_9ROSA|nr:splicing factor 3B subunit 2-like [Pyrus ussuriensis x Pyrus communis]
MEWMVELLRGQKADKVEVTIQPEELDDMETVLPANQKEDFNDMVAENKKKRKRKQDKEEKNKKREFKF